MNVKQGIYVEDINTVYITGAGNIRHAFTGVGRDSIGYNEVVWASSLTRNNEFALQNIDDVDFGYVPQLHLHFPYMNMDEFIVLQSLLRERHLIVDYFDTDLGQRVTHEMAITKNERKKIYSLRNYINGVYDFSVNFVGTNRDVEQLQVAVSYNANGGSGSIETKTYSKTDQVTISDGTGMSRSGKHLASWNTEADGTGESYLPGLSITIWKSLNLYAIWE